MDGPSAFVEMNESSVQGFEIENVDGAFIIRFNEHLGMKDHNLLDMAVRGIMFIKPLNVVMDFVEYHKYEERIIQPILDLAKSIKDIEGNVVFKTENPQLLERLKAW